MKILVFASYIYEAGHPEFERNQTGFGMMVRDICSYVGKTEEVFLYTHALTNGFCSENFTVLPHRKSDFLRHLFAVPRAIAFALRQKGASLKNRIRYVYYAWSCSGFYSAWKKVQPDLVHIHGGVVATLPIVQCCRKHGIPYVVTLHGKICDLSHVSGEDKVAERDVFANSPYVTVIASGIKNHLCKITGRKPDGVFVVGNGTSVASEPPDGENIRKKYGIGSEQKIVLSVGNISPWKNQVQTVRSLSMLPEDIKKETVFLVIGNLVDEKFADTVKKLNFENFIRFVGFVPRKCLRNYYYQADCVVLASTEEGFGLSLIEGFAEGTPGVFFSDIDAAEELKNPDCCVCPEDRSDEALRDAIEEVLKKDWDPEKIRGWAQRFSLEAMAENYIRVYKSVLCNN